MLKKALTVLNLLMLTTLAHGSNTDKIALTVNFPTDYANDYPGCYLYYNQQQLSKTGMIPIRPGENTFRLTPNTIISFHKCGDVTKINTYPAPPPHSMDSFKKKAPIDTQEQQSREKNEQTIRENTTIDFPDISQKKPFTK